MADAVSNLLLRISSEDKGAKEDLTGLGAALQALDAESATVTVDVDTGGAQSEILGLVAVLGALEKEKVNVQVDVDAGAAITELTSLQALLSSVDGKDVNVDVGSQQADLSVDADTGAAVAKLSALTALVSYLDGKKINIGVEVDTGAAVAKLGALLLLKNFVEKKGGGGGMGGIIGDLEGIVGAASGAASALANVGGAAGGAGGAAGSGAGEFSKMGSSLFSVAGVSGPVLGVLITLVAVIGTALVGAIAAVIAAIGAAIIMVASLGAAFLAALGPIVALAIAVAASFAKVIQALSAIDAAKKQTDKRSIEGSRAAANAETQRQNALNSVKDALRGIDTAERGLADARTRAANEIISAEQKQAEAARTLKQANQDLAQATVSAFREMADAAEKVSDSLLSIEDAQLSLEEAKLNTREAADALKDFRKETSTAGSEFDNAFSKFSDVDFDLGSLKGVMKNSGLDQQLGGDQETELERKLLSLKRARLSEKEAIDRVSDSETNLKRAREDNLGFQQKGILASQTYVGALNSQRDAQRQFNTAAAELNKVRSTGIDQNASVLAAEDALRAARERSEQAKRNAALVTSGVLSGAQTKAIDSVNKLNSSEKQLLATLMQVRDFAKQFFGPAVQSVLGAVSRGIGSLPSIFAPFQSLMDQLGTTVATGIDTITAEFKSADWAAFFKDAFGGANAIVPELITIFIQLARVFRDLARAAMPILISLLKQFGASLKSALGEGNNTKKFKAFLDKLVPAFMAVVRLAGALGPLLITFITTFAPYGAIILNLITDLLDQFTAFMASPEGKGQIKQFFDAIIPLIKEIIAWIPMLISLLVVLTKLLTPLLTAILQGLRLLVMGLTVALQFVITLAQKIGELLGTFSVKAEKAFSDLQGSISGTWKTVKAFVVGIINSIANWIVSKFNAAKNKVINTWNIMKLGTVTVWNRIKGFIVGVATSIWNWITSKFTSAKNKVLSVWNLMKTGTVVAWNRIKTFIRTVLTSIWTFIKDTFNKVLDFFKSLGSRFYNAGKNLFTNFVNGVKKMAGRVKGAVKDVLGGASNLLPGSEPKDKTSPLYGLKYAGKALMENLVTGVQMGGMQLSNELVGQLTVLPVTGPAASKPASPAQTSSGGGDINIDHLEVTGAGGGPVDPRSGAIELTRELKRRAGGSKRG